MEEVAASAASTNNSTLSLTQQLALIRKMLFSWSSRNYISELVMQAVAFALIGFFRPILTSVEYLADVSWSIELNKYVKYSPFPICTNNKDF